jgi:hypothetical protein
VNASTPQSRRTTTLALIAIVAAAVVPYLSTIDDYFVRDDFGVVQLLAQKPATYFPRWFVSSWMDQIWGYLPDEVRPFPAASYQLTALGGAGSPNLHHVLNIVIHALNGLLVFGIARRAAKLDTAAAALAAVLFVLLPVHAESVAWITGRVDSMPALFYFAAFLLFVIWRERGSWGLYVASLAFFFVALFTKQNTITMVATLAGYDVIVRRQPFLPIVRFVAPYVPFVAMTAGYLWLRYLLFGQVAREGALNGQAIEQFRWLFNRHLNHVVTGVLDGPQWLLWAALATMALFWVWAFRLDTRTPEAGGADAGTIRRLIYFGPVWWLIGVAPVAVAGYSSPRHVYLAAVAWAVTLGLAFDVARRSWKDPARRAAISAAAAMVVTFYTVGLIASVREWNRTAAVSHQIVRDLRSVALGSPPGTLIIVGAPNRSWDWALPFSVQPPFERTDLTKRAFFVSPRALSCCPSHWFEDTRQALREWSAGNGRNSTVALHWDPETGAVSRASEADVPQLPVLSRGLLDIARPDELDRNLRRMLDVLPMPAR